MMEKYEFKETSSQPFEEDGEKFRKVYFRGIDPDRELNVDGFIPKVPLMDYFVAGMEGTLSELIRVHVVEKLTATDDNAE